VVVIPTIPVWLVEGWVMVVVVCTVVGILVVTPSLTVEVVVIVVINILVVTFFSPLGVSFGGNNIEIPAIMKEAAAKARAIVVKDIPFISSQDKF